MVHERAGWYFKCSSAVGRHAKQVLTWAQAFLGLLNMSLMLPPTGRQVHVIKSRSVVIPLSVAGQDTQLVAAS